MTSDDDVMMNSLENQLEIVREYARKQGCQIVGESYDDNVSGMQFDRKGLNQVTQAVDAGKIDAVIVKDLSRLGRHQMQTALFIDYLRQCGVAVISVTEGLNTMDDGHDLIIGVRQLMNDYYAKDIGNKIRHGYREKQKQGLVVKPPFGYWKDRNTGRIRLHPEASVTVQIIYELYCEGLGQKEITRRLNAMERKTPKRLHDERCGKAGGKVYRWTYQSVKNILEEESYAKLMCQYSNFIRHSVQRRAPHLRLFPPMPIPFFILSAPLEKYIIARATSHNRVRRVNHADREPSAITNNTPTIAKRRAPKSPWSGQQDSNLHALAGEPKGDVTTVRVL